MLDITLRHACPGHARPSTCKPVHACAHLCLEAGAALQWGQAALHTLPIVCNAGLAVPPMELRPGLPCTLQLLTPPSPCALPPYACSALPSCARSGSSVWHLGGREERGGAGAGMMGAVAAGVTQRTLEWRMRAAAGATHAAAAGGAGAVMLGEGGRRRRMRGGTGSGPPASQSGGQALRAAGWQDACRCQRACTSKGRRRLRGASAADAQVDGLEGERGGERPVQGSTELHIRAAHAALRLLKHRAGAMLVGWCMHSGLQPSCCHPGGEGGPLA